MRLKEDSGFWAAERRLETETRFARMRSVVCAIIELLNNALLIVLACACDKPSADTISTDFRQVITSVWRLRNGYDFKRTDR